MDELAREGAEMEAAASNNFEAEIERIQNEANTIRTKAQELTRLSKECTVATNEQLSKKQKQANAIIDEATKLIVGSKDKLEQLKNAKAANNSEQKIRKNMHSATAKKFVDAGKEFQSAQEDFEKVLKDRFARQCKIVKPDITGEEMQVIIDSGDTQVFQVAALDARQEQATQALKYIEHRHGELLHLQQSIREMHQLFVDMAVLVESQGEMLRNIEDNVQQANVDVKKGTDDMREALKLQKSARKKMCCCCVVS